MGVLYWMGGSIGCWCHMVCVSSGVQVVDIL